MSTHAPTAALASALHYGSPRIAAARAYLARMIAARDSVESLFGAALDSSADPASERRVDWYASRLTSLDHDIARLQRAIRVACKASGEAAL